jgi:hypothetical protein
MHVVALVNSQKFCENERTLSSCRCKSFFSGLLTLVEDGRGFSLRHVKVHRCPGQEHWFMAASFGPVILVRSKMVLY